jgi:hypothetical protein
VGMRRHADAVVERKYFEFVSDNLDPGLPPKKLFDNLRIDLASSMVPRGLTSTLLWSTSVVFF